MSADKKMKDDEIRAAEEKKGESNIEQGKGDIDKKSGLDGGDTSKKTGASDSQPVDICIEEIALKDIQPNEYNPFIMSKAKISALKKSIQMDGFTVPILVKTKNKDGKYIIVDGEKRYLACKELNLRTITTVVSDKFSKDDHAIISTIKYNTIRGYRKPAAVHILLKNMVDEKKKSANEISVYTGIALSKVKQMISDSVLPSVKQKKAVANVFGKPSFVGGVPVTKDGGTLLAKSAADLLAKKNSISDIENISYTKDKAPGETTLLAFNIPKGINQDVKEKILALINEFGSEEKVVENFPDSKTGIKLSSAQAFYILLNLSYWHWISSISKEKKDEISVKSFTFKKEDLKIVLDTLAMEKGNMLEEDITEGQILASICQKTKKK